MYRISSGTRTLSVLLILVAYHGTFLLPSFHSPSSSTPSSLAAAVSPPYWLSSFKSSQGHKEIGEGGVHGSEYGLREGRDYGDNYGEEYDSSKHYSSKRKMEGYGPNSVIEKYNSKSGLDGYDSTESVAEENDGLFHNPSSSSSSSSSVSFLKRSGTCRPSTNQQRLANMLNAMETLDELDPENLNQLMILARHNLSGVCPPFQPNDFRGLEHQSLCPWTLERNYQADRFPRLLWYARCVCGHCSGAGWGDTMRLFSCIPLYHRVAVIREVCIDGEIHFRWGRESVPVGCVCAHPRARQVD